MTDEQLLKKIIEKGVERGWKNGGAVLAGFDNYVVKMKMSYEGDEEMYKQCLANYARMFITDHDLAKAIWGDKMVCGQGGCGKSPGKCCGRLRIQIVEQVAWQYHLQQVVILEESLQYFKKFL